MNSEQNPPAGSWISLPRVGAASGTCPPAVRTSDLKQLSLEVIGFGAATTFRTHFPPPSSLAAPAFASPPRHQHLPEAMRLATSHPSNAALSSWKGDLLQEGDFPQRPHWGGLPASMGYC